MRPQLQTITEAEFKNLCEYQLAPSLESANLKRAARNILLLTLLYDCGLRAAELVALLVSDLWFNDGPINTMTVRAEIAKNKQERIIPLTYAAQGAIKGAAYNYWKDSLTKPGAYAFPSGSHTGHIKTRQLERLVHKWSMGAIGRGLHPHAFRHSFATRLMRKTNARIVQQLLGHKHLSSTQVYMHPDLTDLHKAINGT